jgi:hypothetical protein
MSADGFQSVILKLPTVLEAFQMPPQCKTAFIKLENGLSGPVPSPEVMCDALRACYRQKFAKECYDFVFRLPIPLFVPEKVQVLIPRYTFTDLPHYVGLAIIRNAPNVLIH